MSNEEKIKNLILILLFILSVSQIIILKDDIKKDSKINELEIIIEQQEDEKEVYINLLEERSINDV